MKALFLSALLFGLVHPGSKLLMSDPSAGLSLLTFCILYVGIRLLVQIPWVLRSGAWRVKSTAEWAILASIGGVGAALQFSEFYGISKGLPVPLVSFLVYTHPVWTVLTARVLKKSKLDLRAGLALLAATVGIALITGGVRGVDSASLPHLTVPVLAGVFISVWVTLSSQARQAGSSSLTVSFYYDVFCLVALVGFAESQGGETLSQGLHYLASPERFLCMTVYSVGVGLLPNLLFYMGSARVSAVRAGFVLLLEPVISSLLSFVIWRDELSAYFYLGALLVLSTNLPDGALSSVLAYGQNVFSSDLPRGFPGIRRAGRAALGLLALLGALAWTSSPSWGTETATRVEEIQERVIYFVEMNPPDASGYNVAGQVKQMEAAKQLAERAYRAMNQTCRFKFESTLTQGLEEDLYRKVQSISQGSAPHATLVGLSRSSFARIAAKAAVGLPLQGISIGAASAKIREINPNFISIVSPWTKQWEAIHKKMNELSCTATNTIGVFDPKDHLSSEFKSAFLEAGLNRQYGLSDFERFDESLKKGEAAPKCVWIAANFSDSGDWIHSLIRSHFKGALFGVGDWNFYTPEAKRLFQGESAKGMDVFVPTGWVPDSSQRSRNFVRQMKQATGEDPSPVSAYTYDAILLAIDQTCGNLKATEFDPKRLLRLPLLRKYEGVGTSGNYLSLMNLIPLNGMGGSHVQ